MGRERVRVGRGRDGRGSEWTEVKSGLKKISRPEKPQKNHKKKKKKLFTPLHSPNSKIPTMASI